MESPGNEAGRLPREFVDAVSGAVAGGVARMFVSPLDVVKIRFQVQLEPVCRGSKNLAKQSISKYTGIGQAMREIVREEGLTGLWRGTVPAQLLVMPYTAIQFIVLHKYKSLMAGSNAEEDHAKLQSSVSFAAGAVAGVAATIGSYPFDLMRTVLASQGEPKMYPDMRSAFRGLLRKGGIPALYAGIGPTLLEIIPYSGLQFGFYDICKKLAWRGLEQPPAASSSPAGESSATPSLSPFAHFVCGLVSGTLSKACCHPLDVVKKRFQVGGLLRHPRYGAHVEERRYQGVVDCVRRIVAEEGVRGLYKGLLPSVFKAAPAAAITFVVYEHVSSALSVMAD